MSIFILCIESGACYIFVRNIHSSNIYPFQITMSRPCNSGVSEMDEICKYELARKVIRAFRLKDIYQQNSADNTSHQTSSTEENKKQSSDSRITSQGSATRLKRSTPDSACVQTCFICFLAGEHRTMKMCMTACFAGVTITCPGALE